jgi:glycosyltransferase involved in cell wall biosynthesis
VFAAAPLDVHNSSFAEIARTHGLSASSPASPETPISGQRVRDVFLNDPALQEIYPLGLLPLGQLYFFDWLATHGRADQRLTDAEIHAFLRESAEDETRGVCLTYLLQPSWQKWFPFALTTGGWEPFRSWIATTYGDHLRQPLPQEVPPDFSTSHRPGDGRGTPEGANMLGHFCNPSGLQQAALWARAALDRAGLRTSCRDVPVPRHLVPSNREQWLGLEIFPVTILTQAATPYFESGYERSGLWPGEDTYRIAYWNWELETVPDEWVEVAQLVDEIWAPTEFVAKAMRARMPRPVYHMLPGVEVGPVETVARVSLHIPEDHFVFLFMFDLHSQVHRKNPEAVFRAFREEFRENDQATLLIKTTGGDIHSADLAQLRETIRGPNVIVLDRLMTRAQAYGLVALSDCFVSLHRSEGFGLGLAEAMLMAKPVIATGYSGNLDFMNRENSILVDYKLAEIEEDRPIYTRGNYWAEPSVEQAALYMRDVYEHPDAARARAERAQRGIRKLLSLDSAGQRMRVRLEQIAAGQRG